MSFRVTLNSAHQRRVNSMNSSLNALDRVERQLASGRRFERPGEAPESAARVLRIGRKRGDIQTYGQNVQAGRGMLSRAEAAVVAMAGVVDAARSLALKMSDSFYDGDRVSQVSSADGLIDSTMDLLNTTYDDMYIFGGNQNDRPPYSIDNAGLVQYGGDSGIMELDVSEGAKSAVTIDPASHFNGDGGGVNILAMLVDLRDQMLADSQAGVAATLSTFEAAVSQLSSASAVVGTLDQRLEVHERINEVQDIELERLRSTIEDTNFAEAAAEMSLRQTAYQASLAATARVQGLSLLNYMR
jgi:flagellar hook-associated protein 3 FlgL